MLAQGTQLDRDNVTQVPESETTYQYLSIEEEEGTEHHKLKAKIRKEYNRRVKLVFKSEHNAKNKIAAINTLAVIVVTHSYGVINGKLEEIQGLEKITRNHLCTDWMHAKKQMLTGTTYHIKRWKRTNEPRKEYKNNNGWTE